MSVLHMIGIALFCALLLVAWYWLLLVVLEGDWHDGL